MRNCTVTRSPCQEIFSTWIETKFGLLALPVPDQLQKGLMDAGIRGEFWMEGSGHRSSLPHHDGIGSFRGEHLNAFSHVFDFGRADEDHLHRRLDRISCEIRQKLPFADRTVDLASVGVAPNTDIQGPQPALVRVFDFFRKQDRSRAGAERGFQSYELLQLPESLVPQQLEERTGLSSGDH